MKYDLGSYLSRKRMSLEEFAAKNSIKTVNDIGLFILNNKQFEVGDDLIEKLAALCTANEPKDQPVEEMLIISPNFSTGVSMDDDEAEVLPAKPLKKKTKTN